MLAGCGDNDPYLAYSYVRSAADFAVDTVRSDTLCEDPGPAFLSSGFDPVATCKATRKLKLTWKRPDDVVDFRGYLLYLDTLRGKEKSDWPNLQKRDHEASVAILDTGSLELGVVIFLYDRRDPPPGIAAGPVQDTVRPGAGRVVAVDTSGRMEEDLGRFIFALATRYGGGKSPGQPLYTRIVVGDKFPPNPFTPRYVPGPRNLEITWARPTDPTSFFDPGKDTGIVARYRLTVTLAGSDDLEERSAAFAPTVSWSVGGVDRGSGASDSVLLNKAKLPYGRVWYLPDSNRARRGMPGPADSLRVELGGLRPREVLDVRVYAFDSAGNHNGNVLSTTVTVHLTDTTRPTTPDLGVVDSLTTRNSFTVRWSASRDLVVPAGGGEPGPADAPNYNIEEYRLTRILKRDSADSSASAGDRRDTVIKVTEALADDSVFTESVRFLPPGKTYFLRLTAVDSTGYISFADSLEVSTLPVAFAGAESSLTCPPGFVPIPAARMKLGESGSSALPDETPVRTVTLGSFCIEPYEHRDASGRFVTNVTWNEADSLCRAISEDDGTALCSEAEWERACEGFDADNPHLHGIQSERDPSILQASCNQSAGDPAMAMSFALRNPVCLTNEGVYDMAGNLSEWVRGRYDDSAYAQLEDSVLAYGYELPARSGRDTVRGMRGGNYLKPNVTPAQAQALARCSNRDFPMQTRPLTRPECRGDGPKIVVIYQAGSLAGHRCVDIPADPEGRSVVDVAPTPGDTSFTKLALFFAGTAKTRTIEIERDSTFRGRKIIAAEFTTPSLVEVEFEEIATGRVVKDTLDGREMRDTSRAALERILKRESPSAAWRPREEGGAFVMRRFYGYPVLLSHPAKPFFASRAVGFRCCSKPRAAAPAPALAKRPR